MPNTVYTVEVSSGVNVYGAARRAIESMIGQEAILFDRVTPENYNLSDEKSIKRATQPAYGVSKGDVAKLEREGVLQLIGVQTYGLVE